ncbi:MULTISPECIES: ribosome biogenesis GTPase YlqF [Jutongia]|jgi:ribosome biogenesis GTPase A|uniref:Ribosome biogenesis GTPase A n=1 Tax=Jutongia huaianensis TaxID=2763668 RepID=A0ABR7N150_9FIRM|nr:ribosome biogenesis GTPase YlqF [Jutongia huaianensis]MBC8561743.1 ribosome biogenesis GTPase YlqF [Jutongia huaianensis]MBS4815295.1 ribosome biogenesis GTPase YlqF [Clostridium sp.]
MEFQWYPGHMSKAKRAMQEDLKLINVIIELVDARVPLSSKNPDIDPMANGKSRIILLNKCDLADSSVTARWKKYYEEKGFFVALVNSKNGKGVKQVNEVIQSACKEKIERDRRRGILNRPIRAMIVGIPNVGKSTFINSFAGKSCTKTGNKPGVTKGKQWIRLNKNVELLDTPGILWPKFEDQTVGLRLAFIGSIKDELSNQYELCMLLMQYLGEHYPKAIPDTYQIEPAENEVELLERVAKRRGCLKAGGEHDLDKAANYVIDDFRNGRLGCISLEQPEK